MPEAIEQVIASVEEKLIEAVDDLRVGESSTTLTAKGSVGEESLSVTFTKTTTTKTEKITVVETEDSLKEIGRNTVLTSEVSSVTTLVDEEAEPVKKGAGKRGRAKASATTVLAAAKLTTAARKKKGRSASVLDEDDESSEASVPTVPRSKKARE